MVDGVNTTNNKKHTIITIVCVVVSVIVILACVITSILVFMQNNKKGSDTPADIPVLSKDYSNPFEAKLTPLYKESSSEIEGFSEKFSALYSLSENTIGWISIPNLNIDDVVVFPKNVTSSHPNDYYLKRNIFGQSSAQVREARSGSVYADYRCVFEKDKFSKNTILYAHTFKNNPNNVMFTGIHSYRDIETYKKSPVITFNTIYGDYKWKVIAAFTTTAYPEGDNGYNFNYFYPDMADEKTEGFINEVKKRAFYNTNVDVVSTDKFLTLSTCCYDYVSSNLSTYQGKGRLVVVARLLREGESEEVDLTNIVENKNRYQPQAYYTKYGLTNPWPTPTWKPF